MSVKADSKIKNMSSKAELVHKVRAAENTYEFENAFRAALEIDGQIDALVIEPYLSEMVYEEEFLGSSFELELSNLIGLVNRYFGNLCYRAYYKEEGITKTTAEYATTWGKLLEALAERAETAVDYIELASCVQMQFAAFKDRGNAESFASTHYENAIRLMTDVNELVDLVGGHLQEEYFQEEYLANKAGEAALGLAKTFQDYAYICFDDNERCNFRNTDVYEQAADKAIELKTQATEDELRYFKEALEEEEDEERLAKI